MFKILFYIYVVFYLFILVVVVVVLLNYIILISVILSLFFYFENVFNSLVLGESLGLYLVQSKLFFALPVFKPKSKSAFKQIVHGVIRSFVFQGTLLFSVFPFLYLFVFGFVFSFEGLQIVTFYVLLFCISLLFKYYSSSIGLFVSKYKKRLIVIYVSFVLVLAFLTQNYLRLIVLGLLLSANGVTHCFNLVFPASFTSKVPFVHELKKNLGRVRTSFRPPFLL